MIVLGSLIAVAGCVIISQSMASGKLGPALVTVGTTLVLVGWLK